MLAAQPANMREVLALIESQKYELGRRDDVLQWIKQNPGPRPSTSQGVNHEQRIICSNVEWPRVRR